VASAAKQTEAVHISAVKILEKSVIPVAEIAALRQVGRFERHGLISAWATAAAAAVVAHRTQTPGHLHATHRRGVGAWVCGEEVVKRAILLHDDHDVLD
jgi:hypothetical protein